MQITKIAGFILLSTLLALTGCEKIEQSVLWIMLEPDAPGSIEGVRVVSDIVYSPRLPRVTYCWICTCRRRTV